MGTNYYHRYAHCDCCGRYDVRHIGKSMVMFQGYRPDPDWPDEFTGRAITSWQDWKAALRADGEVWDEYGRQHDVEEFIADVEQTKPEARRRQYDWMVAHYSDVQYGADILKGEWLDQDGFSFTVGEFT